MLDYTFFKFGSLSAAVVAHIVPLTVVLRHVTEAKYKCLDI